MDSLLGKDISALQNIALSVGLPKFAGKQIAEWLYQKRVVSFDEMTNISQKGRAALSEKYTIGRNSYTAEAISHDGTKKYLFPATKSAVETVYIPDGERATLCISTQAGCRMRCRFCMTGTLGFHGNLSVGEIINQVFSVPDTQSLTNIVFMGEGEPCDNIDNVLGALQILTADWGCGWSPRRITVSSVGYILVFNASSRKAIAILPSACTTLPCRARRDNAYREGLFHRGCHHATAHLRFSSSTASVFRVYPFQGQERHLAPC